MLRTFGGHGQAARRHDNVSYVLSIGGRDDGGADLETVYVMNCMFTHVQRDPTLSALPPTCAHPPRCRVAWKPPLRREHLHKKNHG